MIVAMKFTDPRSEAVMLKIMPVSQSVWPFMKKSVPGPLSAIPASGGYEVQPDFAAPPGTKNETSMKMQLMKKHQKLAMLIRGKVMSIAPIWSGTTKLPNAAKATGTMPK